MKSLREQVAILAGWTFHPEDFGIWKSPEGTEYADPPSFDESSDAILAVIRRRFCTENEQSEFLLALRKVQEDSKLVIGFALATATPEQLCRATIAAAGKEQS